MSSNLPTNPPNMFQKLSQDLPKTSLENKKSKFFSRGVVVVICFLQGPGPWVLVGPGRVLVGLTKSSRVLVVLGMVLVGLERSRSRKGMILL